MSPSPQIPQSSELRKTLEFLKQEIFYSINCIQLGQLVAFDPSTQKATVRLLIQRLVGGVVTDYPLLADCPAFVYAGGSGAVTMPYQPGDPCMILFCDRDIDNWFLSGAPAPPNSFRSHDLSDGFALLGFRPMSNPISGYSTSDALVRYGTATYVGAGSDNKIVIQNSSGSLQTALTALCTALTSWVNSDSTTPNPATVIAINAAKTAIQSILR